VGVVIVGLVIIHAFLMEILNWQNTIANNVYLHFASRTSNNLLYGIEYCLQSPPPHPHPLCYVWCGVKEGIMLLKET
jgi:hypothetical protein